MANLLTIAPLALRARANNLAEIIVPVKGSGIRSFDIAPRVQNASGNVALWCNAQCSDAWLGWLHDAVGDGLEMLVGKLAFTVAEADRPAYIADKQALNIADADLLLKAALWVTPDMLATDDEGNSLMPLPDITGRMLVCPNMDSRSVLAWLGLTASDV